MREETFQNGLKPCSPNRYRRESSIEPGKSGFSYDSLVLKIGYFVWFRKSVILSGSENLLFCLVLKIGYFVWFWESAILSGSEIRIFCLVLKIGFFVSVWKSAILYRSENRLFCLGPKIGYFSRSENLLFCLGLKIGYFVSVWKSAILSGSENGLFSLACDSAEAAGVYCRCAEDAWPRHQDVPHCHLQQAPLRQGTEQGSHGRVCASRHHRLPHRLLRHFHQVRQINMCPLFLITPYLPPQKKTTPFPPRMHIGFDLSPTRKQLVCLKQLLGRMREIDKTGIT